MGTMKVAVATTALLAGMFIAASLGAVRADHGQFQGTPGATGGADLQAGYTVRGQAWATELFGRRYGRHLMAAVSMEPGDNATGA